VGAPAPTTPLVAQIKDASLRDEYARRLAGWVGAPDELAIVDRVRRLATPAGNRRPARESASARPDPRDPTLGVEREALKLAVQRPALLGPAFDVLDPLCFTSSAYADVRDAIAKAGGAGSTVGGDAWVSAVLDASSDDTVRALVTELVVEPVFAAAEPDARYAEAQLARLRVRALDRQIAELKSRLQRLNPIEQSSEHNKLFTELITLEKRRRDDLESAG
jgi:DNA primase